MLYFIGAVKYYRFYVEEIAMTNNVLKIFSLDRIYFFLEKQSPYKYHSFAVFLVVYIIKSHNRLDVIYFGLVTFYYIKVKFYRWKKYH